MRIKRLEMLGFKSFAERVVLDFQQPVTGIVGPNGCGKSNVVDAIRWGMGEQSAKNLRGRSMEDVVFGGSESRKPHGMAEVSLVFSTDDGLAPPKYLGFSEIQVTRRLFRNGESEYYLNKTPCRLMDITELFMDTGVGARAYSIIEQGKIGVILHSKPEERRFLIEEAAGVTKFKARKQIALKKIEVTRQNLVRLGDLVSEIRRQLNSLQRQAKKAEKFRQYRDELREIEIFFSVRNHAEIEREREILAAGLEETRRAAADAVRELESAELRLEEGKIALLEEEKAVASAQEEFFRIRGEIGAFENRLEFHRKERAGLEREQGRREEERENLLRQARECDAEKRLLHDQLLQLASEVQVEEEGLRNQSEVLENVSAEETVLTARLEEGRRELFAILGEIARISNIQSGARKRLDAIAERFERSRREAASLREKQAVAAEKVDSLCKERTFLEEKKGGIVTQLEAAIAEEKRLEELRLSTERELQEKRNLLAAKSSRLDSLREMEASLAGYRQGVRSILLSEPFAGRFRGTLADLLETSPENEPAIEAVLGDALQFLIAPDAETAVEGVQFLRKSAGGTVSFLISPPAGVTVEGLPEIGEPLLPRVTILEQNRALVEPLLQGAFLVENLETALAQGCLHPTLTFVTPEGDLVRSGVLSGGGGEGEGGGLIHKKREIRDLAKEVAVLAGEVAALGDRLKELLASASQKGDELRRLRSSLHQAEILQVNMEKDFQRFQEESDRLLDLLAVKGAEENQLCEERGGLEKELEESGCGRDLHEGRKAEIEGETDRLQRELEAMKREIANLREKVTGHRVKAASLREKHDAAGRSLTRLSDLERNLTERRERLSGEDARAEEEAQRIALAISELESSLKSLALRLADGDALLARAREKYEAKSLATREEESRVKALRTRGEELRSSAGAKTLALSEISLRLQHLEESLREKHRVEIASVLPAYRDVEWDEEEKQGRRQELQRCIDEIGEVNLTAIDEYRMLEDRANFLATQKEDLEESLRALQQAIQKINRTTRKRFIETFHQVNAKFREIFPRLFCGGEAELSLTNEEDLLETGIDIIVRPPGKKLQNVTLLSGGEKALTALALVFSIFLIKPSPFCLLDEVDAPLDDANIGRFNDMVREMSAVSQFIMITHNKGTMAVADTLYGITMEEPGVSRTVSVRLS